jgi:hypothetical protein
VREILQLGERAQLGEVGVGDSLNLEHVKGTHIDAIGLALAAGSIDKRCELAGLGAAFFGW